MTGLRGRLFSNRQDAKNAKVNLKFETLSYAPFGLESYGFRKVIFLALLASWRFNGFFE